MLRITCRPKIKVLPGLATSIIVAFFEVLFRKPGNMFSLLLSTVLVRELQETPVSALVVLKDDPSSFRF